MRIKKRYRVVAKYPNEGLYFDDALDYFCWTLRGAESKRIEVECARRRLGFLGYNYVIWDNESQSELKRTA